MYFIVLHDMEQRDNLIFKMREEGIITPFHYQPLHLSPAGIKFGKTVEEKLYATDIASHRLIRLPLYPSILTDQDHIIEKLVSLLVDI